MAKRYATIYSNGHKEETSLPHEAASFVNRSDDQQWFLAGKPVTAVEFGEAVRAAREAAYDKKCKTHKQVRVLHGSSVACYVTKWVRI